MRNYRNFCLNKNLRNIIATAALLLFICASVYFLCEKYGIIDEPLFVGFGLLTGIWIASFVLPLLIFSIVKTNFHMTVLILSIILNFLWTYDMSATALYGWSYSGFAENAVYLGNILTLFLIYCIFLFQNKIKLSIKLTGIYLFLSLVGAVMYYAFKGIAHNLALMPILLCCVTFLYKIKYKTSGKATKNEFVILIFLLLFKSVKDILFFGRDTMLVTIALLIITEVLMLIYYFVRIRNVYVDAKKVIEIEKRLVAVKHKTLGFQIKQHFIFNALTVIQALYAKDAEKAEEAVNRLEAYFVAEASANIKNIIPFSEELAMIDNYFALENLRLDGAIRLVYDVEFDGFELPAFSLQPFVENCVKHAKLTMREDGFIKITSKKKNGNITINISDNGVGFDVNKMGSESVGIANAKERLELYLNAFICIESAPNIGTQITVSFHYDVGRWKP